MGIPIGLTMVILMDFSQVVSPYMRQYDLRDSCVQLVLYYQYLLMLYSDLILQVKNKHCL